MDDRKDVCIYKSRLEDDIGRVNSTPSLNYPLI